jgi:hypothetical protein
MNNSFVQRGGWWYKLAGYSTGDCLLAGHPVISTISGVVIGALVAISYH